MTLTHTTLMFAIIVQFYPQRYHQQQIVKLAVLKLKNNGYFFSIFH